MEIECNEMNTSNRIKVSGDHFAKVISEAVAKHINEISYNTVDRAYYKASDVDFDDVEKALKILQIAVNTYDSDSFHTRNRAIDHFMATGKEPVDGAYEKFTRYIDEMREFFERKAAQVNAFYEALPGKKREAETEILNYLHQAGYKGDNINTILNSMDYDQIEEFKNSLPDELAEYFEEHI